MMDSLKKHFPREKLFSLPGISGKWKKWGFLTTKKVSTRNNKVLPQKLASAEFQYGYHQQKEYYNTKEYYFT